MDVALIEKLLFAFSCFLVFRTFFNYKNPIAIFRSLGFIISFLIVLTFNVNWILNKPISLNLASVALLSLVLISSLIKRFSKWKNFDFEKEEENKSFFKGWVFLVAALIFSFLISYSYFGKDLGTPRYTTPDSGGHYLYDSQTAVSGLMPLFMPNQIYPASGFNPVFEHHHDTHFPGASVAFFILHQLFGSISMVVMLQIFNILLFAGSSLYFFLILLKHNILKSFPALSIIFVVIFLGSFFELLSTSYLNQSFGLFMLLFFVDSFGMAKSKRASIIFPIFAAAGVIISYFYWFPVAVVFAFATGLDHLKKIYETKFKFRENKEAYRLTVVFLAAILLSVGYIIITIKINTVSHSTDGSFSLPGSFLPSVIFILPFALVNLYSLLKKKLEDKETNLLFDFSAAILIYSLMLLLLLFAKKASGYTLSKSYCLAVPLVWLLGIQWIEMNITKIFNVDFFSKVKYFAKENFQMHNYSVVKSIVLVVIMMFIFKDANLGFFPFKGIKIIPVVSDESDMIMNYSDRSINISRDQLKFLDKLKSDYRSFISDGRILVVASPETSLWVFAYSGIWPRSLSLLPIDAKNKGIYAPTSFYSKDVADYNQWLLNDKNHVLIFFNTPSSQTWIKHSGFDMQNYNKLFEVGDNFLLQLKKNIDVNFAYQDIPKNYEKSNDKAAAEIAIPAPFSGEIFSPYNNLTAIGLKLKVNKKNVNSNYYFELYANACLEKGELLVKKEISKKDLTGSINKDFFNIKLPTLLQDSGQKDFCVNLYPKGDNAIDGAVFLYQNSKTSKINSKSYYIFKN